MECNKDEALRAKEIAERKFNAKDTAGAKKFALKAEKLFPGLEGISQMLATLDVYVAAENKIYGEADWYGILGVNPRADDESVRKQYRKLALMLHPDKNKSVGAEGAFKFISEAWSLLSNKSKRAAYDYKRKSGALQQKGTSERDGTSVRPPKSNGFKHFVQTTKTAANAPDATNACHVSNLKPNKNSSQGSASASGAGGRKLKADTFWTVCHACKMQYEYQRVYLHQNLLCPNCRQAFFAVETPPPFSKGALDKIPHHQQSSAPIAANKTTSPSDIRSGGSDQHSAGAHWTPFTKAGGASSVAQAASVVQQTYEKVKREREEAQAAKKREKAGKKRKVMGETRSVTTKKGGNKGIPAYFKPRTVETSQMTKFDCSRELTQMETRNMLVQKARKDISMKLKELESASMPNDAASKKKNCREADMNGVVRQGRDSRGVKDSKDPVNPEQSSNSDDASTLVKSNLEPMSINVPDPDFSDFDKDRTERSFEENQVWAAYDNDDGMPRYYAMIQCVISRDPFKAKISWLNSRTNNELGPLNWVGSGFTKTCGDYKVGRSEINDSLNSFSHKVNWTKGTRGAIRIFPRKGDVWALYRNWSPEWNELTADDVIHKYEMVEVLEDDELGVVVIPLVKVAGFKTVFHQHLDSNQVRRIPREELFRFSHQVPSYLITGQEAPNAPKGCRELDPAATPFDLLEVIPDGKEEDHMGTEVVDRIDVASDSDGKKDAYDNSVQILKESKSPKRPAADIEEVALVATEESKQCQNFTKTDQKPDS